MIDFTGHPYIDIGIATILAFVKKRNPLDINEEDIDKISNYIEINYVKEPLVSFLTVAFPNSGFTNPSFNKSPEKRNAYAKKIIGTYKANPLSDEFCVFTGKNATSISLSEKAPPGRAFRQHIPLLTGEGVINFSPWGDAGLPVSGEALLAVHAFPLGCAKCEGKLLAVHSDNPDLICDFAREFLDFNLKAIALAQSSGDKKLKEAETSPKTLLIKTLLKAERWRKDESSEHRPSSITAYHLSNIGASPSINIYHLPLQVIDFLSKALGADYKSDWNNIVERGWWRSISKRGKEVDESPRRNILYEDLFDLSENAHNFIRLYFLRIPKKFGSKEDPRLTYSIKEEANLVSWRITELFLRRVLNMDKEKINQIRELGDKLAEFIATEDDKQFFRNFFDSRYDRFRFALIKANLRQTKQNRPPLVSFDPYITIFENGSEIPSYDWKLSRDLILIRMIEQLHNKGWLGKNIEDIPQLQTEE